MITRSRARRINSASTAETILRRPALIATRGGRRTGIGVRPSTNASIDSLVTVEPHSAKGSRGSSPRRDDAFRAFAHSPDPDRTRAVGAARRFRPRDKGVDLGGLKSSQASELDNEAKSGTSGRPRMCFAP